jgi:hypothetical protein
LLDDIPPDIWQSLDLLPQIGPTIQYLVAVPDWRPEDATPMAGFSFELCRSTFLLRALIGLPSDVLEYAPEYRAGFFARRMCGVVGLQWHPQSPRAIRSMPVPLAAPFTVVLLGQGQDPAEYAEWAKTCLTPPTIVAEKGGDLGYDQLTLTGLQRRLLFVCDNASDKLPPDFIAEMRDCISRWEPLPLRKVGYEVRGHGSISQNIAAMFNFGIEPPVTGPFERIGEVDAYVRQIVNTTNTVLDARRDVDEMIAEDDFPRRPSLNIFAPAMYAGLPGLNVWPDAPAKIAREFQMVKRILERQTGYSFQTTTQAQAKALMGFEHEPAEDKEFTPLPHPLVRIRQLEVGLAVEALAVLCASELSATVRLPNDINRTLGSVRQFANHYRSNSRSRFRTAEAFRSVQDRLAKAVPDELKALIGQSDGDIRIVSDAHVEWLDIDGMPLCIRRNVSRIPVTPGNLYIGQLTPFPLIRLTPEAFKKILVISALDPTEDRDIRAMFEIAFSVFSPHWKDKLEVEFVDVASVEELMAAFNGFDGVMAIFDGHGSHQDGDAAKLHLGKAEVDVWSLHGKVRVPPIIALSACDTHAADRNHATTASGFLSLGARAVLSSVLPLDARHAATFAARLVYRIADFIPAAVGVFGRALTWTEVVSGLLRMQLLSEFVRELHRKKLISEDQIYDVQLKGTQAINGLAPDPWDIVVAELTKLGIEEAMVRRELRQATANSSAISYLNIGRPETILVDTPEAAALRAKTHEAAADSQEAAGPSSLTSGPQEL